MKAIILAGGYGTRIRSITEDKIPKCMLPVMGRPFIMHMITVLKTQGIIDITLALHHKAEMVKEYLGDKFRYKIEDEPLGTGGAIKNCVSGKEPILVLNGDTVCPIDYADMLLQHKRQITIAVDKHGTHAGVYIINPNIFRTKGIPNKRKFSFETDVIPHLTFSHYPVAFFTDIGTPDSYANVPKDWI